jgi:hypothetical protein
MIGSRRCPRASPARRGDSTAKGSGTDANVALERLAEGDVGRIPDTLGDCLEAHATVPDPGLKWGGVAPERLNKECERFDIVSVSHLGQIPAASASLVHDWELPA